MHVFTNIILMGVNPIKFTPIALNHIAIKLYHFLWETLLEN